MPVSLVVCVMVLVAVGMAVSMVLKWLMRVRVVEVVVTMVGSVVMIVPASYQQRPDAPPEHRGPQTHHDHPRHRTQPRVELLGEDV